MDPAVLPTSHCAPRVLASSCSAPAIPWGSLCSLRQLCHLTFTPHGCASVLRGCCPTLFLLGSRSVRGFASDHLLCLPAQPAAHASLLKLYQLLHYRLPFQTFSSAVEAPLFHRQSRTDSPGSLPAPKPCPMLPFQGRWDPGWGAQLRGEMELATHLRPLEGVY